jgi:hypothetical protein
MINNLEHALFAFSNTAADSAAGFPIFYSSITAQLRSHFFKNRPFLVIIRMSYFSKVTRFFSNRDFYVKLNVNRVVESSDTLCGKVNRKC